MIALARALDRLPARLMLYAVEVADTGFGVGLSPDVADAARLIADEITGYLSNPVRQAEGAGDVSGVSG